MFAFDIIGGYMRYKITTFTSFKFSFALCLFLLVLSKSEHCQGQGEFEGDLKSVSISDSYGLNIPPSASFSYSRNDDIFTFDASASSDPDGNITEYKWDIDNGNLKATGITTSIKLLPGNHIITLTVIDDTGGVMISQSIVTYTTGPERAYATTVNFKGYVTSPSNTTSEMLAYLSDGSDSTFASTSIAGTSNTLQNPKPIGPGPWSNLRVVVRASSQNSNNQLRCTLYSGGTLYNGIYTNLSTSPTEYHSGCNYSFDPKTGGVWTKALVESLYFGVRTNTPITGEVRIYEQYLELTP